MKNSIYNKIMSRTVVMVLAAVGIIAVLIATGLLVLRHEKVSSSDILGDSAAEAAKRIMIEHNENSLRTLVQDRAALSDERLHVTMGYVDQMAFAATAIFAHLEDRDACLDILNNLILNNIVQNTRTELGCYYATEQGEFFIADTYGSNPPEGFDPRPRPWYIEAKEKNALIWTDVYDDAEGRGFAITCAKPFYGLNGEFAGVAGIGTLVTDLYEIVIGSKIGETGSAFILNENGQIVIAEDIQRDADGAPIRENLLESPDKTIRDAAARMINRESGVEHITVQGVDKIIAFHGLEVLPWSLAVIIDTDEAISPALMIESDIVELKRSTVAAYDNRLVFIAVLAAVTFICIILIVTAIISRIANSITNPIRKLTEDAALISDGNLDHILDIKTGDELEILADSFNTMINNVKNITVAKERAERESVEKEREAEIMRDANEKMQSILDVMPLGIMILFADDFSVAYANPAILELLEFESLDDEQVMGVSAFDFLPEFQPDGSNSVEIVNEFFQSDRNTIELQCHKLSGEVFVARINAVTTIYNGKVATLNIIEDVTAEEEYRQMLQNTAQKEQEANQLKSRFLAQMSHEIRTPMNAIIGMTELALRSDSLDAIQEHITTVKQAGTNLLSIINDILDFSKIEAGKLDFVSEEYSVASLLNDIVSIIRMRLVDSHVCFAVRVSKDIPHTLYGDVTRVRQAVLNILSNAVKYTDKGYVSFYVYGELAGSDTINVTFEVTDSGTGIKQENIEELFKDFTQFNLGKHRGVEGVGLGLPIAQSIVSAMEGTIDVRSEYGKGSTFTITLPQKYHSREALASVKKPEGLSVLIFEQNEIYAESLLYTVKDLGAECELVVNGTDLFEKMEGKICDYLFISLPLYRKNKETIKKFGKNTKTVILTDFGEAVSEKNMNVLAMPVYCTNIADVLNGISGKFSYAAGDESTVGFSAPDAKVLLVDDVNTNLKVAQGLLSPYNMRVDLCTGGAEAVLAVQAERYDLVFMDHKMPGVDGVEATRRIRALGEQDSYYSDLPIVALTANAVSGMMEMFMKNGFNDFLDKPINTVVLNAILEKWIPKEKQEQ